MTSSFPNKEKHQKQPTVLQSVQNTLINIVPSTPCMLVRITLIFSRKESSERALNKYDAFLKVNVSSENFNMNTRKKSVHWGVGKGFEMLLSSLASSTI